MKDLAGKTAIVTGGGSGIGLGITRALLGAGMNVAVGDVHEGHLREARQALDNHPRLMALGLDVTDRVDYQQFAQQVESRFGGIHLLVNNAGVAISGPVEAATAEDWDWVLGVNLNGVINGLVTVLPRILCHGEGGHIVNTASTSGLLPHPGAAIYVTSKAAIIGLSESLRCELEPRGVVVSVFCPGPVASRIGQSHKTRAGRQDKSGAEAPASGTKGSEAMMSLLMDPVQVGEIVREGIERDYLYILTHNEHRSGLEERLQAIVAAMPRREQSEAFKEAMAITVRNPAMPAEIARHRSGKP